MRIVAIYKTFDGGEWIDASLASIYRDVDAIVMVHSSTSWLGESGNDVEKPAREWQERNDVDRKIHHVNVDCQKQEQQYAAGLEYIRKAGIQADVVMAVDSDEVWETGHIGNAKRQIAVDGKAVAYQAAMHTYLRTPFYRVDPPYGSPVTFFRDPSWLIKCPRGCKATAAHLANVWFHHFTYVRATEDAVFRKIQQSCVADSNEQTIPNWRGTIWPNLPHGENLHAFQRWRHVWKRIERVYWSDLPAVVRDAQIMRQFWPELLIDGQWQSMMDGERTTLYRLARGLDVVVDLGTFAGMSAVIMSLAAREVHTMDLFEHVPPEQADGDRHYSELYASHEHSYARVLATLGQYGNITVYQSDTVAAASKFADESVDLVLVDADHSYAGTRANWVAWHRCVKRGGLIVLHDDNEIHPGVQQAVREMDASGDVVRRVSLPAESGSLAAFRRV